MIIVHQVTLYGPEFLAKYFAKEENPPIFWTNRFQTCLFAYGTLRAMLVTFGLPACPRNETYLLGTKVAYQNPKI